MVTMALSASVSKLQLQARIQGGPRWHVPPPPQTSKKIVPAYVFFRLLDPVDQS